MDLFIETPKQVAQRQLREQQQQIDALNRATSAFNASQEAYLNTIKNLNTQGVLRTPHAVLDSSASSDETGNLIAGGLSEEDIAVIQRAAQIAQAQKAYEVSNSASEEALFTPAPLKVQKSIKQRFKPSFHHDREDGVATIGYKRERAFDRHRKLMRVLGLIGRVLGIIILTPVLVVAIFTAAYLMTCILNGATPAELPGLLDVMWESGITFLMELMAIN